jgi:hypothetical protein
MAGAGEQQRGCGGQEREAHQQRRAGDQPEQRYHAQGADCGSAEVEGVHAPDPARVAADRQGDRHTRGDERDRRQHADERQRDDELAAQRGADPGGVVEPHEQQRDEHERGGEHGRPARQQRLERALEPASTQVHGQPPRPDAQQRERDRQEREVVREHGGEHAREEYLEGERAAGHEADR